MNVETPGRRIRLPWDNRFKVKPGNDNEAAIKGRHRHLKFLRRLPNGVRENVVAMSGEFIGTFLFLFFAFGGTNVVNTAPAQGQPDDLAANPSKLLFISLCFGFSLAVNAWVFFRVSGGLFNPAVTLGMMLVGAIGYGRGILLVISQLLGAIAAAGVVHGLLPGPLNVQTLLAPNITLAQAVFLEMFLTAQLVFTIFMLAAEKHRATFIAPVGIGLSLFIAELVGVYYTGGSLNPARSFGPCVVQGSFTTYQWIYWVGPILGSMLASGFYIFIKALEYETVNPDQDACSVPCAFDPDSEKDARMAGESQVRIMSNNHRFSTAGTAVTGSSPLSSPVTQQQQFDAPATYAQGPSLEHGRSKET